MSAGRAGRIYGRLLITTAVQPASAPVLDGGSTRDGFGRWYGSFVVRFPRRRLALVIGWRGAKPRTRRDGAEWLGYAFAA